MLEVIRPSAAPSTSSLRARRPTTRVARHTLTHAPRRLNTRAARARTRQTFARETKKNKNKNIVSEEKEKSNKHRVLCTHNPQQHTPPDAKCRSATAQVPRPMAAASPAPPRESLFRPSGMSTPNEVRFVLKGLFEDASRARDKTRCLSRYRQTVHVFSALRPREFMSSSVTVLMTKLALFLFFNSRRFRTAQRFLRRHVVHRRRGGGGRRLAFAGKWRLTQPIICTY